eukprot:gnl/TRDRNA2_/TRDRNA2_80475_c0_seq2.p1 gnl/TRDRNA2_/TRDRNA2_80475_c0~~gnl/TRDRNA2_/TRDRNA2_80475_c0_seq2.p1  ORF type:complete len:304 (-),score=54.66 gnl/TRDRNA2_/TRDRNA2_80475_c0_seq2:45-956(-)
MFRVMMSILLACVSVDLAATHTGGARDSVCGQAKTSADQRQTTSHPCLVEKLRERSLEASDADAELEQTTLGKPAHVATLPRMVPSAVPNSFRPSPDRRWHVQTILGNFASLGLGRRQQLSNFDIRLRAANINEMETKAVAAADAWDFYASAFLDAEGAAEVLAKLGNRADFSCTKLPSESSNRAKFVFTNPDLPIEGSDYYDVLKLDNADLGSTDPWANVIDSIGVKAEQIGDVVVFPDDGVVYMVVDPGATKTVMRLLPKEVPGTGVSISQLEPGEAIPEGGEVQQMILQRLDKRDKGPKR